MIPYILSALVGAWAVGRTKPRTKVEKKHCLGPKTGLTYEVEDFPSAGFVVVKASDGSLVTFTRTPQGLVWFQGRGSQKMLQAIQTDFQRLPPAPPKESP